VLVSEPFQPARAGSNCGGGPCGCTNWRTSGRIGVACAFAPATITTKASKKATDPKTATFRFASRLLTLD
jgi:hypothetical protein